MGYLGSISPLEIAFAEAFPLDDQVGFEKRGLRAKRSITRTEQMRSLSSSGVGTRPPVSRKYTRFCPSRRGKLDIFMARGGLPVLGGKGRVSLRAQADLPQCLNQLILMLGRMQPGKANPQ